MRHDARPQKLCHVMPGSRVPLPKFEFRVEGFRSSMEPTPWPQFKLSSSGQSTLIDDYIRTDLHSPRTNSKTIPHSH